VLALIVTEDELKFVATEIVAAGRGGGRRIMVINGAQNAAAAGGRLDMVLTEARGGAPLCSATISLGETASFDFEPPRQPGLYRITFTTALPSGVALEAHGIITVVDDGMRA
jgi:hypothetical protein